MALLGQLELVEILVRTVLTGEVINNKFNTKVIKDILLKKLYQTYFDI